MKFQNWNLVPILKNTPSLQPEPYQKLPEWRGLVQPIGRYENHHFKFQLITEEGVLFLTVPKKLLEFFRCHVWEKFIIKGVLVEKNVIQVKMARVEKEEEPAGYDFDKKFDLDFYRKTVKQGSALEPHLDGIF